MDFSWKDIPGWTCDDMLALYREVGERWPEGTFVEVGVAYGRSLAFLASAAPGARVIGVDTWDEFMGFDNLAPDVVAVLRSWSCPFNACEHFVGACGVENHTWFMWESSLDAAAWLDETPDFVFIDANHTYDDVRADIRAWLPKVKPGGILAGHDYSPEMFPGVCKAVDELLPERRVAGVVWRVDVTEELINRCRT